MIKEIVQFPNHEKLWFEQNKKELEDIIREEFLKYSLRIEVLDEEGIAPGSSNFFKKIIEHALEKENQPVFNVEELYKIIKIELKSLFYSINKELKIKHDLKDVDSHNTEDIKPIKNKVIKDNRGAFIERSLPSNDQ
ncbi:hypothetical protein DRH27_00275 [Candidatus Falkowbacteria bacterium]|nr:MAG: hypothetical protein DRH27_00275 [Candidatus Falkowbacteria bacterium]